jgi:hypothetical protein
LRTRSSRPIERGADRLIPQGPDFSARPPEPGSPQAAPVGAAIGKGMTTAAGRAFPPPSVRRTATRTGCRARARRHEGRDRPREARRRGARESRPAPEGQDCATSAWNAVYRDSGSAEASVRSSDGGVAPIAPRMRLQTPSDTGISGAVCSAPRKALRPDRNRVLEVFGSPACSRRAAHPRLRGGQERTRQRAIDLVGAHAMHSLRVSKERRIPGFHGARAGR